MVVERDESYNQQFEYLISETQKQGFDHYEISNFGKPNFYSQHNTAYWLGKKYVGIGPSAHSFNGNQRSWNVTSNMKYVQLIQKEELPSEIEELSENDRFNEYILTRLRTVWGVETNQIKEQFGVKFQNILEAHIAPYITSEHVVLVGGAYVLSAKGKYLADKISSDLFVID